MTNEQRLIHYQQLTEEAIKDNLNAINGISEKLTDAIKYSLLSKGKRLRPVLFLGAFYHKKNDDIKNLPLQISKLCFAVEALHTYTLIHDDLPCMDDDDERRGMPSCHKKFGEAFALLAGDALLNLSIESMLDAIKINPKFIDGVDYFYKKTGMGGVVGGQSLEFEILQDKITQEMLLKIIKNKTAALFEAALTIGGICAELSNQSIELLQTFGHNYGMAFQLKDDLQDCNDLSFAKIFGQEKTNELLERYFNNAKKAAEQLDSEFLLFILSSLK